MLKKSFVKVLLLRYDLYTFVGITVEQFGIFLPVGVLQLMHQIFKVDTDNFFDKVVSLNKHLDLLENSLGMLQVLSHYGWCRE